jgi:iron complex outermembrane recepter protein
MHSPVQREFKPNKIMLKFTFAAMLLLLTAGASAQHQLSGTVRDAQTTRALPGATVRLLGTNKGTVADELGNFVFNNLPSGEYQINVSFVGYAEKTEHVNLSQDQSVNVSLDELAILTDAVVVSSTRADEKTPATYSTVSREKIQQQNFGQDLPFLLNWTPSVVTTSDAGTGVGYTGIRIRGSDATRVNVTINGIPYNDSESLGTFWVDIPDIASSSQSIQIQRGVGTSTNGAGAFGASVNVETNRRNETPYAEITNAFGSFNTRKHTLSVGSGLLHDHWVIDARVSKIMSDGFIDRASSDLQSYFFSGGYYSRKTILKAIVFGGKERTYQSWYGVPQSRLNNDQDAMLITAMNEGWNETQTANLLNSGTRTFNPYLYQNQVDDYQQDHFQLHFSQRLKKEITFNAALHYTPGKGYYEEFRFDDDFEKYGLTPVIIGDSTIASADLIRRRWLDNDFYGFTYSLNVDKEKWSLIVGGAWNRYVGKHFGQVTWSEVSVVPTEYQYYFNQGDKRDFNSFVKLNYDLTDRLNGYVDVQHRHIAYDACGLESRQNTFGIDKEYSFWNPKAGLVYALNNRHQLYSSFAIGNREPVRDDFVDNPGSTPQHETLRNVEIGYRATGSRHALQFNYFLMDYKNQLVLTGAINDVGASVRTNVDKSYRTGIELVGLVKLSNKFQWNANLTLSKNKIADFTEVLYDYGVNFDEYNVVERKYSNTDIAFSPNIIAGSQFSYHPFANAEVAWLSKYVGKQYLDNTANNERSIAPYFINDVRISYSWKPSFAREIAFSVLFNNVLNELYESNGYTWGYGGGGVEYRENYYFPQAGRNLMAMITLKL